MARLGLYHLLPVVLYMFTFTQVTTGHHFCAALTGRAIFLQGLTIKGDDLIVIINDQAVALSLNSIEPTKGILGLADGKDLGKWSKVNWLKPAHTSDEPLISMNVIGDQFVGVMFKSLSHKLYDLNTGNNVSGVGEILGKYGIVGDGLVDGSSYVLRTNSYKDEQEQERTVAWVPKAVIVIKGNPNIRLPLAGQEESPFPHYFVSLSPKSLELSFIYSPWHPNSDYGDRQIPSREELPVFGFILDGIIHLAIQARQEVMLFEEPGDLLYMPLSEQGRHYIKVNVTTTVPFNKYFDCSGYRPPLGSKTGRGAKSSGSTNADSSSSLGWIFILFLIMVVVLVVIWGYLSYKEHHPNATLASIKDTVIGYIKEKSNAGRTKADLTSIKSEMTSTTDSSEVVDEAEVKSQKREHKKKARSQQVGGSRGSGQSRGAKKGRSASKKIRDLS